MTDFNIVDLFYLLSSCRVWININDMTINGFIDENALVVASIIMDPSAPVRVCMRANEVTSNDLLKFCVFHLFSLHYLEFLFQHSSIPSFTFLTVEF